MARRVMSSRVARYRGKVSIDVVELLPVAGQHIDSLLYSGLLSLVTEKSDIVIDGDLSQQALESYMFRVYDSSLNIKAGNIIIYNVDRYKIISVVAKLAPLTGLMIRATRIDL